MHRRWPAFVGIAAGATLVALLAGQLGIVRTMELKTYDLRVAATAPGGGPSPGVVLVSIDDDSIKRMEPLVGRWPWPRVVHAWLIDYLAEAGAKAIVYDVLFAERDQKRFTLGDTEWTGEASDHELVEATRRAGNVIHAAEVASAELVDPSRAVPVTIEGVPSLVQPIAIDNCVERRPVITPPFADLAKAARGIGHTLFVLDPDGPLRRVPPVVTVNGHVVASLSLEATMLEQGIDPSTVEVSERAMRLGGRTVPLVTDAVADYESSSARACRAMVAWRGPVQQADGRPSFESYPFYSVIYSREQALAGEKPEIDASAFKDRVVIVGATAQGLGDVFTTPFAEGRLSGPEVHANVIDAWSSGRAIARAPWWAGALAAALVALLVAAVGMRANAWVTGLGAAALALAFLSTAISMFARGLWLPVTVPSLALVLAYVGDLGWKYVVEGREKRLVKHLFSRYVAKDVFDQLMADPSRAALGGSRRSMTVLFSDVRGFTALSEKGTPEEIVRQLNEYFSRMVAVLFAHHGTLDKFVGDAVMALFGAPLDDEAHAEHAVQTAIAMSHELDQLNREWAAAGRATLDIGIGINSGDMVAGNIGSAAIMSYTVIGDAVNLAARLESLNKDHGSRIIISEATRSRLKGRYDVRPLGEVVVKGKTQPVAIFEVKPS